MSSEGAHSMRPAYADCICRRRQKRAQRRTAEGKLRPIPADTAPKQAGRICEVHPPGMSGAAVAEIFVKRIQPWLDEMPFGRLCRLWSVPKFELLQGNEIIFPKPRLMQRVPDKSKESIILEVATGNLKRAPRQHQVGCGQRCPCCGQRRVQAAAQNCSSL